MTSQGRVVNAALDGNSDAATREMLYVENSKGADVAVVDIATRKVVDRFEIGDRPDDIISSNAGDVLYMSVRKTHLEPPNEEPINDPGDVVAISTATHEILWRLPVSGWPDHLIISPDDRYLYQPIHNSNYLEVIDTEKRASIRKIPVGLGSHGTRLSPDGKRVYVGCMYSDHISVFDTDTYEILRVYPFQEAVRPFSLTSDEKRMYVQLSKLHGFMVVDLETGEIIEQVDLPALPADVEVPQIWNYTVNHGMNITHDDKLLLAAGSVAHYVAVYSLPDHELVAQIPTGKQPNWIIFSKDKTLCFVSCRASDEISIISMADLKEIDRINVGYWPQRMTTVLKTVN